MEDLYSDGSKTLRHVNPLVSFRRSFLDDREVRRLIREMGGYFHPHQWNRAARRRAAAILRRSRTK